MQRWTGYLWVVVLAGGAGIVGSGCGSAIHVPGKDAGTSSDVPISSGGAVGSGGATALGGTTTTAKGGAGGAGGTGTGGSTMTGTGGRNTGGTTNGGSGGTEVVNEGGARTGGTVGSGGAGTGGVVGAGGAGTGGVVGGGGSGAGGTATGGSGGTVSSGAAGSAAGGSFSDGGSSDGASGCTDVCALYGAACCVWSDPCLVPTSSCTFDVLAASVGTTYEYADLETKIAALPQDISASFTDQDIAWAAADPWPAGRIELHLTENAASRYGTILDGARDGRVFRVSCGGQSLFVGVFYLVYGAAALDTPVLHEARENGVLILRIGAYQSAWAGVGVDQPVTSPLRERIDQSELRAALCRRGVLHVLDPNARPANP
jgi:hypothetical protein